MSKLDNKKFMVIILISLLIVLGVCIFIFIFELNRNEKLKDHTTNSILVKETYSYEKDLGINNIYGIPLDNVSSKNYTTTVSYEDGKAKKLIEEITIRYRMIVDNSTKKFCNSYNDIEDGYMLICKIDSNGIMITNSFDLTKVDNPVKSKNYIINLDTKLNDSIDVLYNKGFELMKVLE
jgi:hypothetical protein